MIISQKSSEDKNAVIRQQQDLVAAQQAGIRGLELRLTREDAVEDCYATFGRRIGEAQNLFVTTGLGGLIELIVVAPAPRTPQTFQAAIEQYRRLRAAAIGVHNDGQTWFERGERLPCPID